MKRIMILAAVAAAMVLVACKKEKADESVVTDEFATVTQNATEVVGEAVEAVTAEAPAEK